VSQLKTLKSQLDTDLLMAREKHEALQVGLWIALYSKTVWLHEC